MINIQPQYHRILAIAPSTKGIGFAVLEGPQRLIGWGVKAVKGDKNAASLKRADELIARYQPTLLVLQNTSSQNCHRGPRIKKLTKALAKLASRRKIQVTFVKREQVKRAFLENGEGTKHDISEILAARFPQELGHRLPPKRKLWQSEDSRMDMFDAVALAVSAFI